MIYPVTAIILCYNEEANLPDLIKSMKEINVNLFAVDSYSSDNTLKILAENNIPFIQHTFENYSRQRNWAQDNMPFKTEWVLHLDSGERLTKEFVQWFNNSFDPLRSVDGYIFSRRTMIFGKEVKYGGQYPQYHLRLFKTEKGRCEDKLYDQHFYLNGTSEVVRGHVDIIDTVMENWHAFIVGHARWAVFEATEQLSGKEDSGKVKASLTGSPIEQKRWLKNNLFQKSPIFLRAFLFFIYRYFFRLGFLDGKTGLAFHFLQGCWFRFLVDAVMLELKTKMKLQNISLEEIIQKEYGDKYPQLVNELKKKTG
jgi:glycosyltransferase involved in cell wall biosynthesis